MSTSVCRWGAELVLPTARRPSICRCPFLALCGRTRRSDPRRRAAALVRVPSPRQQEVAASRLPCPHGSVSSVRTHTTRTFHIVSSVPRCVLLAAAARRKALHRARALCAVPRAPSGSLMAILYPQQQTITGPTRQDLLHPPARAVAKRPRQRRPNQVWAASQAPATSLAGDQGGWASGGPSMNRSGHPAHAAVARLRCGLELPRTVTAHSMWSGRYGRPHAPRDAQHAVAAAAAAAPHIAPLRAHRLERRSSISW